MRNTECLEPQIGTASPEEMAEQHRRWCAAVEKIASAARSFLATYDEFYPEYPDTLGESLDALIDAMEGLDV